MLASILTKMEAMPLTSLLLFLMLVGFFLVLLYAQFKHDGFDLRELLCIEGKVSLEKTATAVAMVISSWGFVTLIVSNKMTEWYFVAYMVSWAGLRVLSGGVLSSSLQNKQANVDKSV